MKSLKETLIDNLSSGKQIIEKLKLDKNTKYKENPRLEKNAELTEKNEHIQGYKKTIDFNLPKIDNENSELVNNWKKITIPNKTYFVFKDYYRSKCLHLAAMDDMLFNISFNSFDYEGFEPSKDILYASNDEMEIITWMLNYMGIKLSDLKIEDDFSNISDIDEDDTINLADDLCSNRSSLSRTIHDDIGFLIRTLFGNDKIVIDKRVKTDKDIQDFLIQFV